MSVDMTKNLIYAFCTIDGGPAIVVQKRGSGVKRFGVGLETEYRFQIGPETWGDNNTRGDIKVDNNARGDIKVDNKVDNKIWDDTVNRFRTMQEQVSLSFGREKAVIARHISNTFKEWALDRNSVYAKFAYTSQYGAMVGKIQVKEFYLYNLTCNLVASRHGMEAA
jgi:hypothetical protein